MTDITVPPEVLAAVDEVIFYEGGSVETACIALLKAWPGAFQTTTQINRDATEVLILPLPAESANAEG